MDSKDLKEFRIMLGKLVSSKTEKDAEKIMKEMMEFIDDKDDILINVTMSTYYNVIKAITVGEEHFPIEKFNDK